MICTVEGCDKPVEKNRRMCAMHRSRLQTTGSLEIDPARKDAANEKRRVAMQGRIVSEETRAKLREIGLQQGRSICRVEGCERFVEASGLCVMHRSRLRKTGTTDDPDPVETARKKGAVSKGKTWTPERRAKLSTTKLAANQKRPDLAEYNRTHKPEEWAALSYEEKLARTAKMRAASTAGRAPTALEAKVFDVLDSLEVSFQAYAVIETLEVDCYIPNRRLIIEVDGGRWHNLSDRAERDKRRDAFLRRKGYTVERITEQEIDTNLKEKVEGLLDSNPSVW